MATLTRINIADRALEVLGVKAAGVSAVAEDGNAALEKTDAVYARLRAEGLAPFALSAVPEYAQTQVIHLVASDLAPMFGVSGERLQSLGINEMKARRELATQVAVGRAPTPIKPEWF